MMEQVPECIRHAGAYIFVDNSLLFTRETAEGASVGKDWSQIQNPAAVRLLVTIRGKYSEA
jgi:hypothetical protein